MSLFSRLPEVSQINAQSCPSGQGTILQPNADMHFARRSRLFPHNSPVDPCVDAVLGWIQNCCVGVFHPVPSGIPAGTGQSPHIVPKPLRDVIKPPHWLCQTNSLIMFVYNKDASRIAPSYSWANYLRVHSQVKLYHSFKQGWQEGSITSENMRFHTQQNPPAPTPKKCTSHSLHTLLLDSIFQVRLPTTGHISALPLDV